MLLKPSASKSYAGPFGGDLPWNRSVRTWRRGRGGKGGSALPSNSPAGWSQRAFAAEPMRSSSGKLRKEHRARSHGLHYRYTNTNEYSLNSL